MHPAVHAKQYSSRAAVIMAGSGATLNYGELDSRSNQGAQLFRSLGLYPGDVIALCLENSPIFFEITWAAQRSGLYYVCISTKLLSDEVEYILQDSGAKIFVTSSSIYENILTHLATSRLALFVVDGKVDGYRNFISERALMPNAPIADEQAGYDMLYSSGTTGRPKGIRPKAICGEPIAVDDPLALAAPRLYGASAESVYLCPAPLYHAAPLRWCMAMMRLGASVVIMERFDPEGALAAIERYHVSIAQFVPTHFVRMLKLPPGSRSAHNLSSLKTVIHAAAPCPVEIKLRMMEWLGPIIYEYYAGSEGNGGTFIGPEEWLAHKGSVGRPLTTKVHVCDEDGNEVPPRTEGLIHFSGGPSFAYHNDPEKTAQSRNARGWTTLGDIGWVDEEGYLYLTDRKSFMIISGGVNIYPQELENLLITHPKVADAAVIGAPHPEMGEEVVAIIQPLVWEDAGESLAQELMGFARANISHVKGPRRVDFMKELPRHATGKLYKRLLRDRYWADASTQRVG